MHIRNRFPVRRSAALPTLAIALLLGAATSSAFPQNAQHYTQTNLTSNQASLAPTRDANLVNPWGLARSSKGPWWVSDNGTGLSTLYDGTGKIIPRVVPVPPSDPNTPPGSPTGIVFNGDANSFQIAPGKAAAFLFVTEDGTISGWNPTVSPSAVIVVNNKTKSVFKGATIATVNKNGVAQSYLYAADFRQGKVAVYDAAFAPVYLSGGNEEEREEHEAGAFTDERIPDGYAPFNIQNIGGNLVVAFAKQDSAKHDEVQGAGKGYVDVFSPTGHLLLRLQHGDFLNAPWGLALGSSDFGAFSHDLLVGQFGSGQILAFDPVTGKYKGPLQNASNAPIVIDGLWAICFGNGASAGPANSLYFTAGIDHEQNGLFGAITPVENVQGNDQ